MTLIGKFKTFEFSASNEKMDYLIFLNNPFFGNKINIISSIYNNSKWIYIVGISNNEYLTKKMNIQFEYNLKSLKIKYKKYYSLTIYEFPNKINNLTLQYLIRRIMILFTLNDIKILSYILLDRNIHFFDIPIISRYIIKERTNNNIILLFKVNKFNKAEELLINNNIYDLTNSLIESKKILLFNQEIQNLINNHIIVNNDTNANNELVNVLKGVITSIITPATSNPNPL